LNTILSTILNNCLTTLPTAVVSCKMFLQDTTADYRLNDKKGVSHE